MAPELICRRWEHLLYTRQYHGFYFTAGEDEEKITFRFQIIPVNSRENPKDGHTPPDTRHTLAVGRSKGQPAPPDYSSAYAQRVIGIVLRDLVDATILK